LNGAPCCCEHEAIRLQKGGTSRAIVAENLSAVCALSIILLLTVLVAAFEPKEHLATAVLTRHLAKTIRKVLPLYADDAVL
jgi:hypothetical protein